MDWRKELYDTEEKPLDRLVDGYSNTSVFRTMAFVGDSLSSGEFENRSESGEPTYHDMFEYSWGQYIARKNGLKAYSFSRGGMTTREYVESFAEAKGYWDPDKAAQAYVIALGVNDLFFKGIELGSIDDVDVNDRNNNQPTYMGYYATIIARYKEISPDAKFFLVTFPHSTTPGREDKIRGMINGLYDLAKAFDNTYVINLYEYGPVYDDEFYEHFGLYGHLNPQGYIFTARIIDSYIDYIIRKNPKDFAAAGFINSGIVFR